MEIEEIRDDIDFTHELTMKDIFSMAFLYNRKINYNEPDICAYAEKNILRLMRDFGKDISSVFAIVRKHSTHEKCGKTCPFCQSYLFVVKKGFDKKGHQKYQCGNCKKNFTDLSQRCGSK